MFKNANLQLNHSLDLAFVDALGGNRYVDPILEGDAENMFLNCKGLKGSSGILESDVIKVAKPVFTDAETLTDYDWLVSKKLA